MPDSADGNTALRRVVAEEMISDLLIWEDVRQERIRAHRKHGDTSMESSAPNTYRRLAILLEEVGEVAKEFNDAEHDNRPVDLKKLAKELIQTAAMAGAWAHACLRALEGLRCPHRDDGWCDDCMKEPF